MRQLNREQQWRIQRTVNQAAGFWARAGLPRARRERMASELQDHLTDTLADGRQIQDVVGEDPVAFAAGWAKVARVRPWLDRTLTVAIIVLVGAGLMSFIDPAGELDRAGLTHSKLFMLGIVLAATLGGEAVRSLRDRLSRSWTVGAGIVGGVLAFVLGATLAPTYASEHVLVAIPTKVAVALILLGLVAQLVQWRIRSDDGTTHRPRHV